MRILLYKKLNEGEWHPLLTRKLILMDKHVIFEGPDKVGKTTQADLLCQAIEAVGQKCKVLHPFKSEGRRRQLADLGFELAKENEFAGEIVLAAAHAYHQTEVRRLLNEGWFVISDRSSLSTRAYKSFRLGLERINRLVDSTTVYNQGFHFIITRKASRSLLDPSEGPEAWLADNYDSVERFYRTWARALIHDGHLGIHLDCGQYSSVAVVHAQIVGWINRWYGARLELQYLS